MPANPIRKPTYSQDQIGHIFDRIHLPQELRHHDATKLDEASRLQYLATLQRSMLTSVPFENLELHYSPTHTISIDPDALYHKTVTQGTGRGGYCMENNAFFATLLRSLGFSIYSVGARVNSVNAAALPPSATPEERERYTGWTHMVNVVVVGDGRYMVDVGFGTGGPTHPLSLIDREPSVNMQSEPKQEVRLRWDSIPENENQSLKLWVYERRIGEENAWVPGYCFPDGLETLPADFNVMNHFTSTSRTSFFTYTVICSKFLLSEDGQHIVGDVTLNGKDCHRRVRGDKEALATFETEEERIQGLDRWLGVQLSEAQKSGITGMVSSL
ncbi:hypothetical protein MBLNU230_g3173t1 [Neophaeotheca triangularis]